MSMARLSRRDTETGAVIADRKWVMPAVSLVKAGVPLESSEHAGRFPRVPH